MDDPVAVTLRRYAQNALIIIFGLLPLLCIPTTVAPFDYTKVAIVITAVLIALVLYSLSILRSPSLSFSVSYPLIALWSIVLVSFLSALLSNDFRDAFMGDFFSIHSTAFVGVLALVGTVWMLLRVDKRSVFHMYILLAVSTLILVLYHISRLIFGVDFLSFGIFTSNVSTPVGSWNDLALFLGLTVILSMVTLEQLSLSGFGRGIFAVVATLSLFMLGVINFFMVWLVLGLTSLVMVVYTLGKDRFSGNQPSFLVESQQKNKASLTLMIVVLFTSIIFMVGGATLGSVISKVTGVSYVEVRPSFEATADIAQHVYHENAFLGMGTNKFVDAWRLYKDDAINQTAFWNTDFVAGSGYITTFFVTTGVLGGLAWMAFLILFVGIGVRRLLNAADIDRMWYFVGVSSFISAVYIWGLSIVYVPGVVILLFGALCTGIALSSFSAMSPQSERTLVLGANRRTGVALTGVTIIIIVLSVTVLYGVGKHYSSVYAFNESVLDMQKGKDIGALERQVQEAYSLSMSDVFARRIAEYQLERLTKLISLKNPTEEDQIQFKRAMEIGITAAKEATRIDDLESQNWSVLGNIYGMLASIGIEGAESEALKAFTRARELNPKNPLPYLESAIVEGRSGNIDGARGYIEKAIQIKPNFTEAFYFLSQLEIATGNVEGAIKSTQAIIALDPQNPARYYQLGVLEVARKNTTGAIVAFEKAVEYDTNYANARYLLALAYDEVGESDDAKKQLEAVLDLNPGNSEVTALIEMINSEGSLKRLRESNMQSSVVSETSPVVNESGTVSTPQGSDTPLVTPVNVESKANEVPRDIETSSPSPAVGEGESAQ